jgi:hypothetical protein
MGYGLDNREICVLFPAEAEHFSLLHSLQTGSGIHPASYPMGNWGSFLKVKLPGSEADH